jgi:hypothetical protein
MDIHTDHAQQNHRVRPKKLTKKSARRALGSALRPLRHSQTNNEHANDPDIAEQTKKTVTKSTDASSREAQLEQWLKKKEARAEKARQQRRARRGGAIGTVSGSKQRGHSQSTMTASLKPSSALLKGKNLISVKLSPPSSSSNSAANSATSSPKASVYTDDTNIGTSNNDLNMSSASSASSSSSSSSNTQHSRSHSPALESRPVRVEPSSPIGKLVRVVGEQLSRKRKPQAVLGLRTQSNQPCASARSTTADKKRKVRCVVLCCMVLREY